MKKLTLILLSVLMIVTLAACGNKCDHTYDNACDATCNECGETREVGAHDFADADCDTAKTCKTCGATEGSALGHEWTTPDVDLCEVQSTCSRCGATDGENKEHTPAEDDGDCSTEVKCTVCGDVTTPAGQHTPNDDDGDCTTAITCSVCGTTTTPAKDSHTGGTATCTEKAVCAACGTAYGAIDANNHIDENADHTCDRECGKTDIGTHADSDEDNDHVCDYGCGATLNNHEGGTATCVAQAVCTICGNGYGDLAPNNHASTEFTYTDNGDGTHSSVCQYCGYVDTTTTEEHIYYIDENCKCSECGAEHYLPFVEEGDCFCDYCFEYIHNPGENCVCTICSIPVHTIDSTTGICSDCNTFVAAASITVDDVKTYYATFDEAIAYANGQNSTVIVIENDCDVMDWSTKFSSGSITIDLNGKTIGSHSGYSIPIKGATVTIRDSVGGGKTLETVGGWSGTLIIEGGTHSSANNPENLIITGGNFTHVCVNTGKTTISGGSFETISIHKNTGTFTDILADGYCFYDKDGKAVDASTIQTDEYGWYYLYNVTVGAIK